MAETITTSVSLFLEILMKKGRFPISALPILAELKANLFGGKWRSAGGWFENISAKKMYLGKKGQTSALTKHKFCDLTLCFVESAFIFVGLLFLV